MHLKSIITFVVILLLADLLFAQLAKLVAPVGDVRSFARNEQMYRAASDEYNHGLKPNVEALSSWGPLKFQIATNSLGFKDARVRDVPLKIPAPRILFIGDSFTEGVGYSHEETFVGLLSEMLAADGIEVLNAGVVSYAPSIYYSKVKYLLEVVGLEFDELVVFLDISDIHDEAVVYKTITGELESGSGPPSEEAMLDAALDADPYAEIKYLIKSNSIIARIADLAKDVILGRTSWLTVSNDDPWYLRTVKLDRSAWTADEFLWEQFGKEGLRISAEKMSALADLIRKHNIGLTLVVYPNPTQILTPERNDRYTEFWKQWSKDNATGFVDLFPSFVGNLPPRQVLEAFYIPLDVHWNSGGHEHVADEFLKLFRPTGIPQFRSEIAYPELPTQTATES